MSRTLARKVAQVKPGTLFVGVDLGLDRNVAVIITEGARRVAKFSFPHDRAGYAYFRGRVGKLCERHQAREPLVGMEPTNYLWKLLATDLEEHAIPYRLVNAYTVKQHREGDQLDRSKDDVRDAFFIADLLRTGKFTETRLLHGPYAELRHYVALYDSLRCQIGQHRNRLHAGVGALFPELTSVFKDLTGKTALAMLRYQAAACVIRQMSQEDFIAGVRAHFQGQRLQVSKLRRAHEVASTSVGLREGVQALQLMVRQQIEGLERLDQQWQEARMAMLDVFLATPEAPYLLSVPCLGQVTAAIILAEIGDPKQYRHAGQLIKLAGTQPVPNKSGRKSRSPTPMSHKGRPRLRTALFYAVLRLIQVDDAFAREYLRFQQREVNPLAKLQALGALMNKLLRILWALMRHRTFYDPARVHAG